MHTTHTLHAVCAHTTAPYPAWLPLANHHHHLCTRCTHTKQDTRVSYVRHALGPGFESAHAPTCPQPSMCPADAQARCVRKYKSTCTCAHTPQAAHRAHRPRDRSLQATPPPARPWASYKRPSVSFSAVTGTGGRVSHPDSGVSGAQAWRSMKPAARTPARVHAARTRPRFPYAPRTANGPLVAVASPGRPHSPPSARTG